MLDSYSVTDLLDYAIRNHASDIHLVDREWPRLRIHGELKEIKDFGRTKSEWILMLMSLEDRKDFEEGKRYEIDFAYQHKGERFRVNAFRESSGMSATLRHIPSSLPELDKLGLPKAIRKLTTLKRGLVIVTGPTGSGKSTTLAAIINEINKSRSERIITIEDPIEFVHPNIKSFISHREIGRHTKSFADALRGALRQDPDIILVGEMRDLETMDLALKAALTGHLVLTTLHTISAAKTVDRIIDVFPASTKNQIRNDLADVIEAVVSQILLPRKDGRGRIVAVELMFATTAIRNLIREGKTFQIPSVIQTSKKEGMVLLDDYLLDLLQREMIEPETAFYNAVDKKKFYPFLKTKTKMQLDENTEAAAFSQFEKETKKEEEKPKKLSLEIL